MKVWFHSTCIVVLLSLATAGTGLLAETSSEQPRTTGDPEIPLDELELRLRPLTRSELQVEADGWLKLLQAKVREISTAEIAAKHKRAELKKADEVKAALKKVKKAEKAAGEAPADKEAAEKLEQAKQAAERSTSEAQELVTKAEQDTETKEIVDTAVKKGEEKAREEAEKAAADAEADEKKSDESADKQKEQPVVEKAIEKREQIRSSLLEYLTELRAQQTALVDRTNLVVDNFEKKGGKVELVEEYRQYITSVSGIKVDVSDAEATWTTVVGWLTSDEGGLRWLQNISAFIVIVLAFMFLARLVGKALEKVVARSRQTSRLLGNFLVVTVRRVIIALGVLVGLAAMDVNIGPLLAVIGAAGFVIAFALQNSLGNFASGILILVFRPFDVGDVIEAGGVLGKVESMNLLSVLIRTPDNKAVIVPNNNIWGGAITNATGTATRRVDLVFGIAYDDDIEHAQRILKQVVSEHERVLKEPEPVIRVHELGESSVNFVCRPWVRTEDYWDVYWDLTQTVKQRFDKEGISIPFPQRDVHLISALPQGAGAAG
jgi:small conductance mechanosensitive channel